MALFEGVQIVNADPVTPAGNLWFNTSAYALKVNLRGGTTATLVDTIFSSSVFNSVTNAPTTFSPFTAYTVTVPTSFLIQGRTIHFHINGLAIANLISSNITVGLLLNNTAVCLLAIPSPGGGDGSYFTGDIDLNINLVNGASSVTVCNGVLLGGAGGVFTSPVIVSGPNTTTANLSTSNSTFGLAVANSSTSALSTTYVSIQGCYYFVVN